MDINDRTLDVGNGVRMMDNQNAVDTQVQGKRQIDMVDGNLHASLFGGVCSNLIYHPVLDRWQINQNSQYDKQQDRTQQDASYPP